MMTYTRQLMSDVIFPAVKNAAVDILGILCLHNPIFESKQIKVCLARENLCMKVCDSYSLSAAYRERLALSVSSVYIDCDVVAAFGRRFKMAAAADRQRHRRRRPKQSCEIRR